MPDVTPADEAVIAALAALSSDGEAPRVGCVGITGTGKTVGLFALIKAWLARSTGQSFILDPKGKGRYDEVIDPACIAVRASVSDARSRPLLPGTRVVVFKGDPFRGRRLDPNAISQLAWATAGRSPTARVLVVHDELVPFAARFGQWLGGDEGYVQQSFIVGRECGVGVFWATTGLVSVPLDASGQSEIWAWQCTPNDARLLRKRGYCVGLPEGFLERLPGPPLPLAQRGAFVRLRPEQPWDGRVYRF